jgi:hypothetical protein
VFVPAASTDLHAWGTVLEAYDASVWKRLNDSWVCVLHTESPKGDPFGRH